MVLACKVQGGSFWAKEREKSTGNVCFHGAQLRETEHILNIYVSELVRQEHNSILHEEQMSRARKTDEA